MSGEALSRSLAFRCPRELEGKLPTPTAAIRGLPDWLREMPANTKNNLTSETSETLKRCPPFVDAMAVGFLLPLMCDLWVDRGEFTWDNDLPPGKLVEYPRSPIGFHDASQAVGSPYFQPGQCLIKFHNLWMIDAPQGYSLLFMHPINRAELPFTTLSGIVDCDLYRDSWIHFPAQWRDVGFKGLLPRGTPIAQCVPIKREDWIAETAVFSDADAATTREVTSNISRERGVYRRRFRA